MNEDDFINEIIQNPHDETLRIVFADYLEDVGDPRAELIRLQVQRAELGRFDPARARLRARELKLLKAHGGFGKTPPSIKATERHGGFVDGIECTITRFLNLQEEIFSSAPIRYVKLTGQSAKFDKLNESVYLGRIAGLTFKSSKATTEQLCRLVSNSGLSELRHLDIRSSGSDVRADAVMRALGSAKSLAKLESLSVSGYFTIGESLAELLGAAFKLRQLSVSVVGDQQLRLLAD